LIAPATLNERKRQTTSATARQIATARVLEDHLGEWLGGDLAQDDDHRQGDEEVVRPSSRLMASKPVTRVATSRAASTHTGRGRSVRSRWEVNGQEGDDQEDERASRLWSPFPPRSARPVAAADDRREGIATATTHGGKVEPRPAEGHDEDEEDARG